MATFQYRAVSAAGRQTNGTLEAGDRAQALAQLRQQGVTPIEVNEEAGPARTRGRRIGAAGRRAAAKAVGELGVLLGAGLSIDRALALAIENSERAEVTERLVAALRQVREGVPLSRAIGAAGDLLPPMAQAMIEAGEANGRLGEAMARLATMLEAREDLRQLIVGSAIYPAALLTIAIGVILLMLLYVIPQFETVFASTPNAKLPASSMAIMGVSRFVRTYGWYLLAGIVAAGFALRRAFVQPAARATIDRIILEVPQLGTIVRYAQTAQLARTLAVLVEGGVDLPVALGMAQRALTNGHIAAAVARAGAELREGGGLSGPLAATGVFPRLALGFFRTGEETSQLAPMLDRLADVLEREVRLRIDRLVAILTPAITVLLGGIVATVIASIMSAILGFNDLAMG